MLTSMPEEWIKGRWRRISRRAPPRNMTPLISSKVRPTGQRLTGFYYNTIEIDRRSTFGNVQIKALV